MFCNYEVMLLISVLKTVHYIGCIIVFFYFVISLMVELSKIIINSSDENAIKIKKMLWWRFISMIIFFLIPYLVFVLLKMFLPGNLNNIEVIEKFWKFS